MAPGGVRQTGVRNALLVRALGLAMGTGRPNLFATVGRHRRLFRGWLRFASRLMPRGRLARRDTELVILRVAHLRGSTYELEHHERLGRQAGLTGEELLRVVAGPAAPGWSDRDRALLLAAEGLVLAGDLDDATWATLRAHLDEAEAIELLFLVGHYDLLATVIRTLRIAPDGPRPLPRWLRRG
ncbi:carboxymuconolactone decarboxylase family protein [Patulibacter sp. S7RM1-6]